MKKVHFETNKGNIVAELYDTETPGTVENFVGLVAGTKEWTDPKSGKKVTRPYYDGLTFHRYVAGFVIQGGCPKGNGTGGPGYNIKCECEKNTHKHMGGTLSMAHAGKDTGGSQCFICLANADHLNGKHTVFGQVTDGMDVVLKIRENDRMNKVWIEG